MVPWRLGIRATEKDRKKQKKDRKRQKNTEKYR